MFVILFISKTTLQRVNTKCKEMLDLSKQGVYNLHALCLTAIRDQFVFEKC